MALNRAIEWQKGVAAARAQLPGILLEVAHAERCLESYLTRNPNLVSDPGYRLATQFLGSGIGILAAGGALRGVEAERLHQLYIDAESRSPRTLATRGRSAGGVAGAGSITSSPLLAA